MTKAQFRRVGWLRRLTLLATGGSALFLSNCDPTIRTTVENGIISVSNAALASFLQALVELGAEAN